MSINGANRLGSNSLPELLVFGARAGRAAAEYAASAGRPAGGDRQHRPRDEVRRLERDLLGTEPGDRTRRRDPGRDADDHGGERRHLPHRAVDGQGRGHPGRAAAAGRPASASRTPAGRSTPSWSPRSSWPTCSTSPSASCSSGLQREESRGAHQRTDFPARDDERFLTHLLVHRRPGRHVAGRAPAGDDHPVAAGRAGLREVAMADSSGSTDTIGLRVSRYRPDSDTEPHWQEYDVPLRQRVDGARRAQPRQERDRPHACRSAGRAGWGSAAAAG